MKTEEIIAGLQEIFDDLFLEQVELTPALSADQVDEWDSLLQISLVVAVEKKFKVRFRVGEVEATKNVGEFAELIARRMTAG